MTTYTHERHSRGTPGESNVTDSCGGIGAQRRRLLRRGRSTATPRATGSRPRLFGSHTAPPNQSPLTSKEPTHLPRRGGMRYSSFNEMVTFRRNKALVFSNPLHP
ncbi:hypothetical protein SKAU_G00349880 [Synaphobranchus kaupii]|uniref:Uncharacterized protein n=1 Tax=Synaphobranchus kaupii TaxID=118154 RepID=A0A9Q1EKB0_SYNKA|nr:hypothetical protein SKAU_G00349880 [Synaphobranchus kaupii]